jgi:hypothetical protein
VVPPSVDPPLAAWRDVWEDLQVRLCRSGSPTAGEGRDHSLTDIVLVEDQENCCAGTQGKVLGGHNRQGDHGAELHSLDTHTAVVQDRLVVHDLCTCVGDPCLAASPLRRRRAVLIRGAVAHNHRQGRELGPVTPWLPLTWGDRLLSHGWLVVLAAPAVVGAGVQPVT